MAEEITNNPAPLTARQVAAENPELNKLREIAFGTNYLDDIDAGTGTARFYSGFGQQPTYTGTNTDQSVADAVTAQAETVAAPVQESGGQDQVTGEPQLTESGTFGGNPTYTTTPGTTVDSETGDITNPDGTPGGNIVDEFGQDGNVYASSFDPTTGDVTNVDGTYSGNIMDEFSETPESFAAQQGIDYSGLDQEGQRDIDEQFKATPDITPALDMNPFKIAANIVTGGITDIPFVGTAVQKASDYFTGDGNDSVASTTTSTMGDPSVDAFENDPNNIEDIQTPLEAATGINQVDIAEGPPEIRGDDETITLEPDPTPSFQGSPAYSGSDSGNDTDTSSTNEADVEAGLGTESIAGEISNAANQAANPQDSSQGSSSSGSKIVCTMMNDTYGFGNFRNKIWLRQSKDLAPEYQKGYHKIFLPLVKLSKTNVVIRKVLEHIAVHRTIDIRQEARGKAHILGRIYRKILEPICYLVGKYVK